MAAKEDILYTWFNPRGRKTFKPIDRAQLTEKFPAYARIGLPAHKAALDGNVEALKDIYSAFTDDGVPSRDVNGATPLHLAVRGNRTDAVKWLLRFTDLTPTTPAKHGETPCHVAAVLGNTECLKAMLGADTKGEISVANDNSGFTPLHLAIVKSRNEAAKILMSELGVRGMGAVNESGITAAHVAASAGNAEMLKMIASKNKKYLSQATNDGTTPLYYAAQEGRLTAVQYLHEKGKCDLSMPSNDGRQPIHAACQCGHTHVVKYIVSKLNNSAILEPGPDGATTLHYAASTGQIKTARWLIDTDIGGTLINMKDSSGDTPAHDAADNGKIETLKLLLECGADLYAINNDGNTPYSLALSSQHAGMADFVMSFASNAPQKTVEGPSQMTIFDMQGEVDVVDFQPDNKITVEAAVELEIVGNKDVGEVKKHVSPNEKKIKKKEKKEKEKKDKKLKDKKAKKNGNSFLGSSGAALLAMPHDVPDESEKASGDDKVLSLTEEELDMFKEEHKASDDAKMTKQAPPSSDGSDIVVSYTDSTPPAKTKLSRSRLPPPEQITTPNYSTVSEIERAEKKKEKKKMGRKNSKPIQKQKHEEDSSKNVEGAGAILSGPQMGFKPQFHTNPLQGYSIGAPPTPPPTPATGFSSSATSEVGIGSTEDEDDMPYDMYSHDVEERRSPDDKQNKEEKDDRKENGVQSAKCDDPVENLVTNLDEEDDEEEEEDKKPVLKKWPPPKVIDYKPAEAKMIQPSGENVLKKWQPNPDQASTSPEKKGRDTHEVKGHANVAKKWPPASPEPKLPSPKIATTCLTAKASSPLYDPSPEDTPQEPVMEREKILVKVQSMEKGDTTTMQPQDEEHKMNKTEILKRAIKAQPDDGHQVNERDKVTLKKSTKACANYSSPSTEATSGADNELTALLKLRQNKI